MLATSEEFGRLPAGRAVLKAASFASSKQRGEVKDAADAESETDDIRIEKTIRKSTSNRVSD